MSGQWEQMSIDILIGVKINWYPQLQLLDFWQTKTGLEHLVGLKTSYYINDVNMATLWIAENKWEFDGMKKPYLCTYEP